MRTHWEYDDFGVYEEELEETICAKSFLREREVKPFRPSLKKIPRILYAKQSMTPYCHPILPML